jgi:hypothetical protein
VKRLVLGLVLLAGVLLSLPEKSSASNATCIRDYTPRPSTILFVPEVHYEANNSYRSPRDTLRALVTR